MKVPQNKIIREKLSQHFQMHFLISLQGCSVLKIALRLKLNSPGHSRLGVDISAPNLLCVLVGVIRVCECVCCGFREF